MTLLVGLLTTALFALGAFCLSLVMRQRQKVEKAKEQSEAAVHRLSQELEFARKDKVRFIRNLSSELRRPLNSVLGCSEILLSKEVPDWMRKHILTLRDAAELLNDTTDNLVQYVELEGEKQLSSSVGFSLSARLKSVLDNFEEEAKSRRARCEWDRDELLEEVAGEFVGDPFHLGNILTTMGNAVLSGCKEGAELYAAASRTGSDEKCSSFEICVGGRGITLTRDERKRIWSALDDTDKTREFRLSDPYFALNLSARFAQLMGGGLEIKNASSEELEFSFRFQLDHKKKADPVLFPGTKEPSYDPLNLRLLLVEDDLTNGFVAEQLLNQLGCEVVRAENGLQAVELCMNERFDVILMDCELPGIDGLQATSLIRSVEDKANAHTPIIALTANVLADNRLKCSSAGMDAFLSKPVSKEDLYRALSSCLQSRVEVHAVH